MQTAEIRTRGGINFKDLVKGVKCLKADELNLLFEKVNHYQNEKFLSEIEEETLLLKKIQELIPASVMRRYKSLNNKQRNGSITEKEQSEVLFIVNYIEKTSAERVAFMAKLAKIRKTSLSDIAEQLNSKR